MAKLTTSGIKNRKLACCEMEQGLRIFKLTDALTLLKKRERDMRFWILIKDVWRCM